MNVTYVRTIVLIYSSDVSEDSLIQVETFVFYDRLEPEIKKSMLQTKTDEGLGRSTDIVNNVQNDILCDTSEAKHQLAKRTLIIHNSFKSIHAYISRTSVGYIQELAFNSITRQTVSNRSVWW